MKKVIVRLDVHDGKDKQKAMKAVATISGIDFLGIDIKEKKVTIIGDVDPVSIASKLRKFWHAEIIFVGPDKEPEKKEEPKKEEEKKEEPKKEEPKKEEEAKKKEEPKKEEEKKKDPHEHIPELVNAYRAYNPYMTTHYFVRSAEENPNACVIS